MNTEVLVRDAMTQKIVTVDASATSDKAAKLMAKNGIGCVVVVKNGKPLGIVTERDISYRVVAKNKLPNGIAVKDIMSKPLKTITPDKTLTEAGRLMVKNNIRRLPVVENKTLVGIITDRDILAIAPHTIEILKELSSGLEEREPSTKEVPEKGTCEVCGDYAVTVYEVDGTYMCESCKEDRLGGE